MKRLIDLDLIVKPKDIKIFLGKYNGFQRYDIIKYPFANKLKQICVKHFEHLKK